VVIASCTPRTHEPLFQDTLRQVGLNPHLFEMANLRDQNSWVHKNAPGSATEKAIDAVRMAVAKSSDLYPVHHMQIPVLSVLNNRWRHRWITALSMRIKIPSVSGKRTS
jgi:heterodisulfide reductase subunit A